jgi:threonine dehydratase
MRPSSKQRTKGSWWKGRPGAFSVNVTSAVSTPTIQDIRKAAKTIEEIAYKTPLYRSEYLSRQFQANVFLKLECYQPTRVFKIRGAANKILSLSRSQRRRGVVTASSGNHGFSVAYVARMLGISATIVVPSSVVKEKVEAIRAENASVIEHGRSHAEIFSLAKHIQKERGATFVPPFDDPKVIAGQGTIGLEIMEDLPSIDTVLVPVGGGGLISGVSLSIKALKPETKIHGVQSRAMPSMYESLSAGRPVRLVPLETIADGLAPEEPSRLTFQITKKNVISILLTSEARIRWATRMTLEQLHLLIEPSAAAVIAALGESYMPRKGENLVLVISGGNISLKLLHELLVSG